MLKTLNGTQVISSDAVGSPRSPRAVLRSAQGGITAAQEAFALGNSGGGGNANDLQDLARLSAGATKRMEAVQERARLCEVLREQLAQAEREHNEVVRLMGQEEFQDKHQRGMQQSLGSPRHAQNVNVSFPGAHVPV